MSKMNYIEVTVGRAGEEEHDIETEHMTEQEERTLRKRITMYLAECAVRRRAEAKKHAESNSRQKTLCQDCNGTGEVRKRVFSDRYQKYVYVKKGTMACRCQDKQEDVGP